MWSIFALVTFIAGIYFLFEDRFLTDYFLAFFNISNATYMFPESKNVTSEKFNFRPPLPSVGSKCFRHFSQTKYGLQRWYMDGTPEISVEHGKNRRVWPEDSIDDDRIESQLLLHPDNLYNDSAKDKLILIAGNRGAFQNRHPTDQRYFFRQKCPFCSCKFTYNFSLAGEADAIIFVDRIMSTFVEVSKNQKKELNYFSEVPLCCLLNNMFIVKLKVYKRPKGQIWIFSTLEASFQITDDAFALINWTAS